MKTVKSSELKAKLAQFLRLVRSGEEIEVTDRGIVIAKIIGIFSNKNPQSHGLSLNNNESDFELKTIPARKPMKDLSKLKSTAKLSDKNEDVVHFLTESRRK